MAQTVTIGEQKVCPESESLKFSTTPTPQVENPSDSSTPTSQPWLKPSVLEVNNILSTKAIAFVFFVRFFRAN